jgi:hypothetical protein
MTLLYCDSFDHYATADILKKWNYSAGLSGAPSPSISASGRFGSGMYIPSDPAAGNVARARKVAAISTGTSGYLGMAVFMTGTPTTGSSWPFISILENTTLHLYVAASTASSNRAILSVYRGSDNSVVGTGTIPILANYWYYIELGFVIADSGSTDTRNGGTGDMTEFEVRASSGSSWYIDDLYLCDGNGSVCNTFQGDIRVQAIFPTADGGTTQWTPSTGTTHYTLVDEATPNTTDYVSETTAGEKDTFAFGNLTPTSGSVKGVQTLIYASSDDAGSPTMCAVYGNGTPASDVDGTTTSPLSTTWAYYIETKDQNPVGSTDWTISSVNGAEFGVKRVG